MSLIQSMINIASDAERAKLEQWRDQTQAMLIRLLERRATKPSIVQPLRTRI